MIFKISSRNLGNVEELKYRNNINPERADDFMLFSINDICLFCFRVEFVHEFQPMARNMDKGKIESVL